MSVQERSERLILKLEIYSRKTKLLSRCAEEGIKPPCGVGPALAPGVHLVDVPEKAQQHQHDVETS